MVVPDPMKVGDWVMWNGGSSTGVVKAVGNGVAQIYITTLSPNKLSLTTFTVPYPIEKLTVIPEAIAKILNS